MSNQIVTDDKALPTRNKSGVTGSLRATDDKTALDIRELQDTQIFENNASGQPIYVGCAKPGTAVSAAGWMIKKHTYDANGAITNIQFADGNEDYDNVWNDRASATYS